MLLDEYFSEQGMRSNIGISVVSPWGSRSPRPALHRVRLRRGGTAKPYDGAGSCFIEFGDHTVGRVDVDFLTGPSVVAPFTEASLQGAEEKKEFAESRRRLWFGR